MNERDIIRLFRRRAGEKKEELLQGIGDDCAVLQADSDRSWLVTMDTLVESVHFDLSWHPAEKLGWKSLAVNVSDVAAMGGEPSFAFLSLGMPRGVSRQWLDRFSTGLEVACREYGCSLAGGDTVSSPWGMIITITLIGEAARDRILYRKNARPGDDIWVSGNLGNAAAGLELCRQEGAGDDKVYASLMEAHLAPRPPLELSLRLASGGLVHAMMDLSDGLATDLAHLCAQSGTGALVYADLLPLAPLTRDAASGMGRDVLQWALAGGEDYQLLFTASPEARGDLSDLAGQGMITRIGTIDEGSGVRLVEGGPDPRIRDISYLGYEHFRD